MQLTCPWIAHILLLARVDLGSRGRTGQVATVCAQCDKPEAECTCDKYCCYCQAQHNIRMGVDGLYYCPDCREACDVRLAESDDH